MAVRVVSQYPVKTKREVCLNCRYELEYVDPGDLEVNSGKDYDGGGYTQYWITCPRPECGKRTLIKEI